MRDGILYLREGTIPEEYEEYNILKNAGIQFDIVYIRGLKFPEFEDYEHNIYISNDIVRYAKWRSDVNL